jgi:hypothetical protein
MKAEHTVASYNAEILQVKLQLVVIKMTQKYFMTRGLVNRYIPKSWTLPYPKQMVVMMLL